MPTLLLDGSPIAEVEVARTLAERSKGLLGRDGIGAGLVLKPASSVHTVGMRFPIDVVYVDRRGTVLAVTTMQRHRLGLPRPRCKWILETEAGRARQWGISAGRRLEVSQPA